MSGYLDNKICKFKPLKDINFNIKKKLFFLSLFKMKAGGYKNFNKYLNGIRKLDQIAKDNDMEVRIFIDDTINSDLEIKNMLQSLETVTLILYGCSDFLVDKHHVGLFGTLVRFFPLFKFPNNDAKVAFIVDADVVERFMKTQLDIYNAIKENKLTKKIYIAYGGNFFHINRNSNKKIMHKGNEYIFPYCVADRIIGFKKINPKPFLKFMARILLYMNGDNRPEKILSNYYISPDKYKIKCENNICFGIDEFFLNQILFKYLLTHDKPFAYHDVFDMASFNYYKHPNSPELRKHGEYNEDYKNAFMKYMKLVGLDKYSYKEIDEKIYTENKHIMATGFMKDYANKVEELMDFAKKNNDNTIFNDHDYYYLNNVDYHKYFKIEYIRFINYDMDDIILNTVRR